jgi:hypothetical protein
MSPIILLLVPSALASGFCEVVDSGSAAFIRNSYVELGLGNDGAFGEGGYPAGWHYRSNSGQFGFVANPQQNAWATFYGDFFSPGSPLEGWGLKVNGAIATNFNNGEMGVPGTLGDPACEIDICGNLGGAVEWHGSVGSLAVGIQYGVVNDEIYIVQTVTVENTGTDTIPNVFWFRNVDPDNAVMNGGGYGTTNRILSQPDAESTLASVRATGSDGSDLYLMASDFRARVSHGGFYNPDGEAIWLGTGFYSSVGATETSDSAISLAIHLGDIAPGEKEVFRVIYALDETAVASATACAETPPDPDTDGDGIPDTADGCPSDPANDEDGDGVCGDIDQCPGFDDSLDFDADGEPDFCDADSDGDGFDKAEDCNDADIAIYLGALEVLDGLDNDCDFLIDDELPSYDDDGDGFSEDSGDCDDSSTSVFPEATEIADGQDNNCDGLVDNQLPTFDDDGDGLTEIDGDCDDSDASLGLPRIWFEDKDGDGHGWPLAGTVACTIPPNYVASEDDCDDRNNLRYPGAEESCYDLFDRNCDGSFGSEDADHDRWFACEECDDLDGSVHPGAEEACDGKDNNCNGSVDEDCASEEPGDTEDSATTDTMDSDMILDSDTSSSQSETCDTDETWAGGWSCGILTAPRYWLISAIAFLLLRRKPQ